MTAHLNLLGHAEHCLFEFQCQVLAKIGATLRARAATAATLASEHVAEAEEVAKNILKVVEDGCVEAARARAAAYAGMTEAIVAGTFLRIRQYGVRFAALFEALLRLRIVGIAIRMELQRQLAISALDLLVVRRARHAQHFVVVTFHCCGQNSTSSRLKVPSAKTDPCTK